MECPRRTAGRVLLVIGLAVVTAAAQATLRVVGDGPLPGGASSEQGTPAPRDATKPNILILLADDLGYGDVGVQGCKDIPTPNIDAIANAGVRFTSGYPGHCVCAPSRASLMTGQYQHRFGLEMNPGPAQSASPDWGLPREIPTLAEKLRAAGYATGMVGKWHLGFAEGKRPHERGFDYHFGFVAAQHPYLPGRNSVGIIRNGEPVEEKEYLTDAFAREAVAFLDRSRDRPFFLYLAFNAVHLPLQAAQKYEARFRDIADPKRRTYACMLSAMDDAVGAVMAKLHALGQDERTLVIFYSDNGGPTVATTSRNDPLRGHKGEFLEGGIRTPFMAQWKGTIPPGGIFGWPVMAFDIHATVVAAAQAAPGLAKADGVDLLPYVLGQKTTPPHDRLFWRTNGMHAARLGDWKLLHDRTGRDYLFNLKDDVGETTDLAMREPARLAELQAAYAAWAKELPPAPDSRPAAGADSRPAPDAESRPASQPSRPVLDALFAALDKNGDGKLSPEEFGRPRIFQQLDKNGDGFLTKNEVTARQLRR